MKILSSIIGVSFAFLAVGLPIYQMWQDHMREVNSLRREHEWYHKTFPVLQGATQKFSYTFLSLDSGTTWYAVERDDKGYKIKGPAEEVYPGEVARHLGMVALTDHVVKNGPINLADPKGLALLTSAGFTVTEKK